MLVASPFQTTAAGASSLIFFTIIPNGFHCACVSLIMQKCARASAPSVVKVYVAETTGSPSFAS